MRFSRRRPQFVCLGLFALVAQLVSSFGHVHAGGVGYDSAALACRTFFPQAAGNTCPPSHEDDNGCAVCFTISMGGSLVLPEPPALVLPVVSAEGRCPEQTRALTPNVETAAFQARAPPSFVLA
jgi:hypothetical protein